MSANSKGLVWLACMEKPAVIPKAREKEINELMDAHLLTRVSATEYLAVFNGWPQVVKGVDRNLIVRDWRTWQTIFEDPFVRTVFYKEFDLLTLFEGHADDTIKQREAYELMNATAFKVPLLVALWLALNAKTPDIANSLKAGQILNAIPKTNFTVPKGVDLNYYSGVQENLKDQRIKQPKEYDDLMELVRKTYYSGLPTAAGLSTFQALQQKATDIRRRLSKTKANFEKWFK